MLIEIPLRNRKWTTQEIQDFLNELGRAGGLGPSWRPGQPWGPEVQPVMRALGERGAFGPDWVAPPTREEIASRYGWYPSPATQATYPEELLSPEFIDTYRRTNPKPKPKPAPAPQPAPVVAAKPPEPKPISVIELLTAPKPARKPKPPDVSLWECTPEQEAEFKASAARALPFGVFGNGDLAELRSELLAQEARFQDNLARIVAARARKRLREFDLDALVEDRAIHVVGWNRMGYLAAERVRKERLAQIDD